ncbi:hypothetical protein [Georgenia sp. AZ-5]|uniref:hypothetical protein n=1 Tax=Georgenia sp. AZ-5 TaxID=3367526 RepID=UPI0037543585
MARTMVRQHRLAPAATEAMMAAMVDKTHLSRHRPAPPSSGNLHHASTERRHQEVSGGWHGRRRTARRRVATVLFLAGSAVAGRWLLRSTS